MLFPYLGQLDESWIFEVIFVTILCAGYVIGKRCFLTERRRRGVNAKNRAINDTTPCESGEDHVRFNLPCRRRAASASDANAKIVDELSTATKARLCDEGWVAPRIIQLAGSHCSELRSTHAQHAIQFYRSAVNAGLDLKKMPLDDCHKLFASLVSVSVRINKTDDTLELLQDMHKIGPGIDNDILCSVVKLCSSKRLYADCLVIYDSLMAVEAKDLPACNDRGIWSCLLFCATETKSFERNPYLFEQLKLCGTPSKKDYWNMMRYSVALGDWKLMVLLLEGVIANGIQIDNVMISAVHACCASSDQYQQAVALLDQIPKEAPLLWKPTQRGGVGRRGGGRRGPAAQAAMVEKD